MERLLFFNFLFAVVHTQWTLQRLFVPYVRFTFLSIKPFFHHSKYERKGAALSRRYRRLHSSREGFIQVSVMWARYDCLLRWMEVRSQAGTECAIYSKRIINVHWRF